MNHSFKNKRMVHFSFSKKPVCNFCKKEMQEWNPWAETHEHSECTAERISTELIQNLFKVKK